jgi:hypothetical protein
MNQLLQIVCTPVVVFPVLLDMWAIFACLLTLKVLWVSFVPLLLEIVLRYLSVPVHTIATGRSMEDLTATLCASVVTPTSLVVETNTSRTLLCKWRRAWSLHVSSVAKHGHLNANLRNAMLILFVVYRAGPGSQRRTRAATLGRLIFWRKLAKASGLGLRGIGAGHCLNTALCRRSWDRGLWGVKR